MTELKTPIPITNGECQKGKVLYCRNNMCFTNKNLLLPARISRELYPRILSHKSKSWSVAKYPEKARTIHLNDMRSLYEKKRENKFYQWIFFLQKR